MSISMITLALRLTGLSNKKMNFVKLNREILGIQLKAMYQVRCCSNIKDLNLSIKTSQRSKKLKFKRPSLESVLPRNDTSTSPSILEIDKQLNSLDSLLKNLNLKIAEQQEQLDLEEEEMQVQYGVTLPSQYVNMVGSVDPNCPPSKYPCVGCGTPIHCCSPQLPGFISSSKFMALDNIQIQNCKCLRCTSLEGHKVVLDAQVSSDEYRQILTNVKGQRSVLLHVVDVTDYQNSTIPDLLDIVGRQHPVYVIANKVDLMPRDSKGYLHQIEKCVTYYANECYGFNLKHVALVSALTGFGVERLITKLLNHGSKYGSNFHLVGCTNSGKSSLFNTLLKSDLCKEAARDKIARATISTWPGTTLNLLKFPVNRPSKYMLAMRTKRLIEAQNLEISERTDEPLHRNIYNTTLRGLVEPTVESLEDISCEKLEKLSENYEPNEIQSHYNKSTWNDGVKEAHHKDAPASFDYINYEKSRWLFDTPGLVSEAQIINDTKMVDLKRLLMKRKPVPRTYSLRPGMTMFIGGIGRLDILETTNPQKPVYLTVIAAAGLPVAVVYTENADKFYNHSLQEDQLVIPSVDTDITDLPKLVGHTFEIKGVGYQESETDVQLSSIGWVAVTYEDEQMVTLKAYTAGGVGCHTRHSILPYAINLKGQKISGSRTFQRRKPLF